jgi:hypothetical protein
MFLTMKRIKTLIFFISVAFVLFAVGCATVQPEETTSQTVTLEASDEMKAEAFQASVLRLFRRYNPVMVEPLKCAAQYGAYPVTIKYQDNTLYITSSCPNKHVGWLASIREGMKRELR